MKSGIQNDVSFAVSGFESIARRIEARIAFLDTKEARWKYIEEQMDKHASLAEDKIVLDVGT